MTLQELMASALQQLDRGTDAQTVELWRDKLTAFINDAVVDIASEFALRRTDEIPISEGCVDLAALPRACVKVMALEIEGRRWPFYYGADSQSIKAPGAPPSGTAKVTYRYVPARIIADTDIPDVPPWAHSLIALYAVGRERAGGDAASIAAARACFELYNAAKRSIKKQVGENDAYIIENRY